MIVIFHHRQRKKYIIELELIINNTKIEQVKAFDFLGYYQNRRMLELEIAHTKNSWKNILGEWSFESP